MSTRILRILILSVVMAAPLGAQRPLRVLTFRPGPAAAPGDAFTITFDRPVVSAVQSPFDPAGIVRLTPAVAARIEWRDPATIRVVPQELLEPGREYVLRIDTTFTATDGGRLSAPVSIRIRVHGPRLLTSVPGFAARKRVTLSPSGELQLLYSARVDEPMLERTVRIELDGQPRCSAESIAYRVVGQGVVSEQDAGELQWAAQSSDGASAGFIRVVELAPRRPLPADCQGSIFIPSLDSLDTDAMRYPVRTAAPFTVNDLGCGRVDCLFVRDIPLVFTSPVRREDLERHVRFEPSDAFMLTSTEPSGTIWPVRIEFRPRSTYRVIIDPALRDLYGRSFAGSRVLTVVTGDRRPSVVHHAGLIVLPREARPTVRVRHVNVDSVELELWPIPDGERARLAVRQGGPQTPPAGGATVRRMIALEAPLNDSGMTDIALPELGERFRDQLVGVRFRIRYVPPPPRAANPRTPRVARPTARDSLVTAPAFIQRTNLMAHAVVGESEGAVFVTDLRTGQPIRDAVVRLLDPHAAETARGTTDITGVASLQPLRDPIQTGIDMDDANYRHMIGSYREGGWSALEGRAIEVTTSGDRVVVPAEGGFGAMFDYLRPGEYDRWAQRPPSVRAEVFTDRGIYRPGEQVYAAAIVREGSLDALRSPQEQLRWRVSAFVPHSGWAAVRDTTVEFSASGTSADSFRIGTQAALGEYSVQVGLHREGKWRLVGGTRYTVAEYRAPEFLVNLTADTASTVLGDTGRATVAARYLFGTPMSASRVTWRAWFEPRPASDVRIPNLPRGFSVAEDALWWEPQSARPQRPIGGIGSLDSEGRLELRVASADVEMTGGARLHFEAAVEDLNQQVVTEQATQLLHGSTFYLAVRDSAAGYWWSERIPRRLEVLSVRPDGRRVTGIPVRMTLVRHRWERLRADGRPTGRWTWHRDTLHTDSLITADTAVSVTVSPPQGGLYSVHWSATDERRRAVRANLARYVLGASGPTWWGESPTRLPVMLSRDSLRAGDTVAIAFASPFASAEAWVTVERERVLWQRRMTIGAGPVSLPIPIAESFVPNAFLSVLLVNRADAARLDSLHHRVRRGRAGFAVDVAPKRLAVTVEPERAPYAPGDSAVLALRVSDANGRGSPAAVALWAVDEGVLALTGFGGPDPLAQLYPRVSPALRQATALSLLRTTDPAVRWRQLGYDQHGNLLQLRLSEVVVTGVSAMSAPADIQLRGSSALAVGRSAQATLRQDFRTTAFYRAFVTTNAGGRASVAFKLPDNITTFRVIAVAASGEHRFGTGESKLVVNRPIMVRAAMPRFVRPGDDFQAGGTVHALDRAPREVAVRVSARGIDLQDADSLRLALDSSGSAARFRWRAMEGDSARIALSVTDGAAGDAVSVRVPVRPDHVPRAHTFSGVARGTQVLTLPLPGGIDPVRSRLTLRIGSSPLPTIQMAGYYLRHYRYQCTEQLVSIGRYLIAVSALEAVGVASGTDDQSARRDLQELVDQLVRRQKPDGGFGYWSSQSWSTPWLSAQVGLLLADAQERGAVVADGVVSQASDFVVRHLDERLPMADTVFGTRRERWHTAAIAHSDRLAAAHFLHRAGHARGALEARRLVPFTSRMSWEDRIWLAHLLHTSGQVERGRRLLAEAWEPVTLAGNRVEIPDSLLGSGYFGSRVRPSARLLSATLAIDPQHPWLAALAERIVQRARAESVGGLNTQDHASAATALAEFTIRHRGTAATLIASGARPAGTPGRITLRALEGAAQDTTISLNGLIEPRGDSAVLTLRVAAPDGPVYYALTVDEVPRDRELTPDTRGMTVERWYERFDDGSPVTDVQEGDLVRVRLRITVPADREFVALEDLLPAGLEAVDLSLRTMRGIGAFSTHVSDSIRLARDREAAQGTRFGAWYGSWWTPWEHSEKRDDRVVFFARILWAGTYTASYLARATTPGEFIRPPAHAEEMYNPGLNGRSEAGWFRVRERR